MVTSRLYSPGDSPTHTHTHTSVGAVRYRILTIEGVPESRAISARDCTSLAQRLRGIYVNRERKRARGCTHALPASFLAPRIDIFLCALKGVLPALYLHERLWMNCRPYALHNNASFFLSLVLPARVSYYIRSTIMYYSYIARAGKRIRAIFPRSTRERKIQSYLRALEWSTRACFLWESESAGEWFSVIRSGMYMYRRGWEREIRRKTFPTSARILIRWVAAVPYVFLFNFPQLQ